MKQFILKHSQLLAITWALIILGLCSMPGQYIPSVSLLEMLSFDKWVHAGMFFVLCSLLFVNVKKTTSSKNNIYLFLILGILYGSALEVMQGTLFSNRSADWNDIIANSFGCIVAFFLYNKIFLFLSSAK